LAKNFQYRKKSPNPFKYNDKGSMAIIGKNKAVVDIPSPKLHFWLLLGLYGCLSTLFH
jgi:NADH dehydrogenase